MGRTRASRSESASVTAQPVAKSRKRRTRSPSLASHQPTNKKRGQPAAPPTEPEQLYPDLELVAEDTVDTAVSVESSVVVTTVEQQATLADEAQARQVHFSDGNHGIPSPPDTQHDTLPLPQTARTPRSASTTPGPSSGDRRRSSLNPASSSAIIRSSPIGVVEELKYAPLQQVLEPRTRRRLRRSHLSEEVNDIFEHERDDRRTRHALLEAKAQLEAKDRRLQELEWEVESQRQMQIDLGLITEDEDTEQVKDMRAEIASLKKEIEETRALPLDIVVGYDTDSEDDEDDMDVDDNRLQPDDSINLVVPEGGPGVTSLSPTPATRRAGGNSRHTRSSGKPSTHDALPEDPTHELEIAHFEQEITHLTRVIADKEAALKLLILEIQSLGFTLDDETADLILPRIRASFTHLRAELEKLLPAIDTTRHHNGELMNAIPDIIRNLLIQTTTQEQSLSELKATSSVFSKQNTDLLDKLSEAENRKTQLSRQWMELDRETEQKSRLISELQERISTAEEEIENNSAVNANQATTIATLQSETSEFEQTVTRLQTALTGYRDQVSKLEGLITRMEVEHKTEIEQLTEDHTTQVQAIQDRLDTATEHLQVAETELDTKTTQITQLERRVESAETDLDRTETKLAAMQEALENEQDAREELAGDLEDRRVEVDKLVKQVQNLEVLLSESQKELEELRAEVESEREARELAEQEIETLNARITELEQKLHQSGLQSNELKEKLWEAQQQREHQIREMETSVAQREEAFLIDMEAEVGQREEVERELEKKTAKIALLEAKIKELDNAVDALLTEKNELLQHQGQQIENLTSELYMTRETLNKTTSEKATQIDQLNINITDLTKALSVANEDITALEDEVRAANLAHDTALNERDDKIANLTAANEDQAQQVHDLSRENESLSRRVEEEATAMLDLEARFADTAAAQKALLATHSTTIASLRADIDHLTNQKDNGFAARDAEISRLTALSNAREAEVKNLVTVFVAVKEKFNIQVEANRQSVKAMLEPIKTALGYAEEEAKAIDAIASREMLDLETLEEAVTQDILVGTTSVDSAALTTGAATTISNGRAVGPEAKMKKATRKSTRKRVYDSGIGVAEDEVDGEGEMQMEQIR